MPSATLVAPPLCPSPYGALEARRRASGRTLRGSLRASWLALLPCSYSQPLTPLFKGCLNKGRSRPLLTGASPYETSQNAAQPQQKGLHEKGRIGPQGELPQPYAWRYSSLTCYSPQIGYRGAGGQFVLAKKDSPSGVEMKVACGRCQGCRMAKSASWAIRIEHEASLHEANMFLTLTFSDEHLPDDYSVHVRDVQLFMKRLRKSIEPKRVRYFAVGEYGEQSLRPHYHIIIFGHRFDDLKLLRTSNTGFPCYTSDTLSALWPFGLHEIGTVTAQSGGYVARYSMKKVGGSMSLNHYQRLNPYTGEIVGVQPEFACMSTHPGIGNGWFERFERDCFPSDFLITDGRKVPVPEFYKRKLRDRFNNAGSDPACLVPKDDLYPIRQKRRAGARANAHNSTPERLAVREEIAQLRAERLKREL